MIINKAAANTWRFLLSILIPRSLTLNPKARKTQETQCHLCVPPGEMTAQTFIHLFTQQIFTG